MTSAACFRPLLWEQPFSYCDLICDYCEHDLYVLVTFVLKVSSISECSQLDIKLAHDALEELDVFNSCEY